MALNHARTTSVLLAALLVAIPAAQAADLLDQGPSNWSTPPFWASPAPGVAEFAGPDASPRAAGGRQSLAAASPSALPFVAVSPCRLVDTRGNGAPLTGGFLPSATERSYTVAGVCGIPADARAISLNATVVRPVGPGFLTLWPQGGAFPPVSTLNFLGSDVIANAAVVPLSAAGGISVAFGVSGGDLILDTNGYYSPLGVVNSLNGQAGDLTILAGNNVTLTTGTGTLSISAANGTGPQGPAGAAGPQGPAGATGATGPVGPSGATGAAGATGSQGVAGPQGLPGATGPQGATGTTGSFDTTCAIASGDWTQFRNCLLAPVVVFNSILSPIPPNVPSQAFQAQQTAEFGDAITLAGTARKGVSATVLMSDWALHSDYPTMSNAGFVHPITLNFYSDSAHAVAHTPDIGTITQDFLIPWRPAADPACTGGRWKGSDGVCYSGFAFTIEFNLGGVVLPSTFIYGIAYNTNTWGYAPIGANGPYESLNVGLNTVLPQVTVGTDNDLDDVYWNTKTASSYSDGGLAGVGVFRRDTGWAVYVPTVKFTAVN